MQEKCILSITFHAANLAKKVGQHPSLPMNLIQSLYTLSKNLFYFSHYQNLQKADLKCSISIILLCAIRKGCLVCQTFLAT